jgi:BirA family biotin operon repressor/biotin-[acetyl-CoA-carboxylase] ligase
MEFVVIGIGLNLRASPVIDGRDITALSDSPVPEAMANAILQRLSHWRDNSGWGAVREAWLRHALPVGTAMTLRQANRTIAGNFAGLGDDASLLLEVDGRVQIFASGEIWLPGNTREQMPC